jgi:hypothetical protein
METDDQPLLVATTTTGKADGGLLVPDDLRDYIVPGTEFGGGAIGGDDLSSDKMRTI